jgi:hypothetical protein
MQYALEKVRGAMIHITEFYKDLFRLSEVIKGGDTQTHREHDDLVGLLLFFSK